MLAPSSLVRRALVAGLLACVLLGAGGVPATLAIVPVGRAAPVAAQATTAPPATDPAGPVAPDTGGTSPVRSATDQAAQDRADADLWAVWQVVIALGVVAVALLVLLVLYVRATSPRRLAARAATGEAVLAADAGPGADPGHGTVDIPDDAPVVTGADPIDQAAAPEAEASAGRPVRPQAPPPRGTRPGRRPPASARPKRVDAPAKKLATPDAERVLVRPGQAPIRVPVIPPAPPAADPPVSSGGSPRTDGPPPSAPEPPEPGR